MGVVAALLLLSAGGWVGYLVGTAPWLLPDGSELTGGNASGANASSRTPSTPADPSYRHVPETGNRTDVTRVLSIDERHEVSEGRKNLTSLIWRDGLPTGRLPDTVETNVEVSALEPITNEGRTDRLVVRMRHGVTSVAYVLHPKDPGPNTSTAVLYHQGHGGNITEDAEMVDALLANGYTVVGFSMPLLGPNSNPLATTRHGVVRLTEHDDFDAVRTEDFSPLSYYLTPPVTAINYLEASGEYSRYAMTGISGGGWTTTMTAAVDTRISESYAVSGSLPLYLSGEPPNDGSLGHYEGGSARIHTHYSYLDYYLLAAVGEGPRKHVQYLYQYDPCCNAGVGYRSYEGYLERTSSDLGGSFEVVSNDDHRAHSYANRTRRQILEKLSEGTET